MRGSKEVIRSSPVLQSEQVVSVFGPSTRGFVRLLGNQRREVHFLEAGGVHFLAHDPLDVAKSLIAQGQPGEDAGRDPAHVTRAHQQLVTGHLGIGRVVAQSAQQQRRHTQDHEGVLPEGSARG